jgi:hypothetical protein
LSFAKKEIDGAGGKGLLGEFVNGGHDPGMLEAGGPICNPDSHRNRRPLLRAHLAFDAAEGIADIGEELDL